MEKTCDLKGSINNNKGSTSLIIICTTAVVILLAAIVTDIGYSAMARFKLASTAGEAAKLGARELNANGIEAERLMREYAIRSIKGLNRFEANISTDKRAVTVNMGKPLEYIFLRYAGIKGRQLNASATARRSGVSQYKGIRPFAVQRQEFKYHEIYRLYEGPGDKNINQGIAALSMGTSDFRTNVLYGYRKNIKVGSGIYALKEEEKMTWESLISQLADKCKHIPQCTYESYSSDCSRIIILPVVESLDFSGLNPMSLCGFAAFLIEGGTVSEGKNVIWGRFIRHVLDAPVNDSVVDFGLTGVELIQ